MRRHRSIAAAPRRTAAAAWKAACTLVVDTLDRSGAIDRSDVLISLTALDQVGRMLVAAGHFEEHPVILRAGDIWLEISTESGDAALSLDENLNPVPGASDATSWTLHVPQVEPMAKLVRAAVSGDPNLSAEAPPALAESAALAGSNVDLEVLASWAKESA